MDKRSAVSSSVTVAVKGYLIPRPGRSGMNIIDLQAGPDLGLGKLGLLNQAAYTTRGFPQPGGLHNQGASTTRASTTRGSTQPGGFHNQGAYITSGPPQPGPPQPGVLYNQVASTTRGPTYLRASTTRRSTQPGPLQPGASTYVLSHIIIVLYSRVG